MDEVRQRVLDATSRCAMKFSLQRTTVEDVSSESGVSRASIYRYFPGGRDDVIACTVGYEVDLFFLGLASDIGEAKSLEELLVQGIMSAHRRLEEHALFARVMSVEPEIVLPWITIESNRVLGLIADVLRPYVEAELSSRSPSEVESLCDHIARLFLSYLESPGSWALTDEGQVRDLVVSQFVPR
jgi:AcrR family transcriptional regulator